LSPPKGRAADRTDLLWHAQRVPPHPDATVEVVPYSSSWPAEFERAAAALRDAVGPVATSIEHIGSTAVPGLAAKPTIDILVVVASIDQFFDRLSAVEGLGFEYRPNNNVVGGEDHLFLRKVAGGKRTHHVHVVAAGSAEIDGYRTFRDALRSDPDFARRYEQLKFELAHRCADDRMSYVAEKSTWVDAELRRLEDPSRSRPSDC
jgi:GrpB-like predicted nucleotidyltransferase (UPF0157 family)